MFRLTYLPSTLAIVLIGTLLSTAGCDGPTVDPDLAVNESTTPPPVLSNESLALSEGNSEKGKGLATLRRATARYQRVEAAEEDGFQALTCADPPGPGALGIPYVKPDRIDASFDLEKPEVLFYEPQKNGRLRLVGAEPVVTIKAWDETHEDPPSLFGQEFHRNEEAGLYGLHMWVWLHNPDGIFAFTHPEVSCEFAD